MTDQPTPASDGAQLATVILPLRRALLGAARGRENLPDLSEAQIEIIRALQGGQILTPGELATSLAVGRSTVSNLLRSMERDGLVVRRQNARDRRSVEVLASEQALDYFERFDSATSALAEDAIAELSETERTAIVDALPVLEKLKDLLMTARDSARQSGAD